MQLQVQRGDTPINKNAVHIWYVPINNGNEEILNVAEQFLDEWECRRLEAFKFKKDKMLFATAHVLIRIALHGSFHIDLKDLHLQQTEKGKPFVCLPYSDSKPQISISHTDGLAGCAVSTNAEVGFDIEVINESLNVEELLPQVMARSEMEHWSKKSTESPIRKFLSHWVLKEALSKALGVGLSESPTAFAFEIDNDNARLVSLPKKYGHVSDWSFYLKDITKKHIASLVYKSVDDTKVDLHWHKLEMEKLVISHPYL